MSLVRYAYEKVYKLLTNELKGSLSGGLCKNSVEECFIIAGNYWSELRSAVSDYKFATDEEEILFFKTVKPLFTSELEYFSLLYHSFLFCPFDPERQKHFWEREGRRLQEFEEKHPCFLNYHRSKRTDEDHLYYLRKNDSHEMDDELRGYDKEPRSRTSHGHLIATLSALERYNEYAQTKLKEITSLI